VVNPVEDILSGGPRGETPGCPTGLANLPPAPPADPPVSGPLHVEKLEGRQEAARDAQDEAEEDVGAAD
jgi:hypothetical protein